MLTDPFQILITVMLGIAVFLVVWSVFRYPVNAQAEVHRQIALAMGRGERQTIFETSFLAPITGVALSCARRMSLPGLRLWVRRQLDGSGNPNGYSVDEYLAASMLCSVTMAAAATLLSLAFLGSFNLLGFAAMGAVGFGVPLYSLHGESNKRLHRIARKLPYTLDLIALMMGAGSTFTEAVQTIIREEPEDDFNQELAIVLSEIEFGTKRSTALANMAERIPTEALRSIVGAVNQAELLGTPLSLILKNQSGMLRMHRTVRAEKISASASLRILLPSMLILVAVVIFVFGPVLVRMMKGQLQVM